jgi:hypothetical protein
VDGGDRLGEDREKPSYPSLPVPPVPLDSTLSAKDILFVVNATTEKILIPPDGEGDEKIPMVAVACGELHETGVQRAFGNL